MVEQLLLLFQALFLVGLFVFIWRVMRTASRDLRLPQESVLLAPIGGGGRTYEPAHAELVVVASANLTLGARYEVSTAPLTIGRSPENAIALEGDDYASSRHARVEPFRDGIFVVDLGSRNGTFVNGEPVGGRRLLRPGDLLHVGSTELRLES